MLKPSNFGTWIFFALNAAVFAGVSWLIDPGLVVPAIWLYVIINVIVLSPVGEAIMCAEIGAKRIVRKDMQLKIIPNLEVVLEKALDQTPTLTRNIRLKIIHDQAPNALAVGRRTICITDGVLDLPDEAIMGLLAHEVGHLANKHTDIQLLIGGGNIFITGFILILRIISWIVAGISGILAWKSRSCAIGCLMGIVGAFTVAVVWLWTKFCMLFLTWSKRKNEFAADKYASKIGFGNELAYALDSIGVVYPREQMLKALYSTHPDVHERIGRLQEMGASYSRY